MLASMLAVAAGPAVTFTAGTHRITAFVRQRSNSPERSQADQIRRSSRPSRLHSIATVSWTWRTPFRSPALKTERTSCRFSRRESGRTVLRHIRRLHHAGKPARFDERRTDPITFRLCRAASFPVALCTLSHRRVCDAVRVPLTAC